MSSNLPQPLDDAVAHLRARRLSEARAILAPYVRAHPDSDQAWYLLSLALTDLAQQKDCLRRALEVNPANTPARERLAALNAPTGAPAVAPSPPSAVPPAPRATAPPTSLSRGPAPPARPVQRRPVEPAATPPPAPVSAAAPPPDPFGRLRQQASATEQPATPEGAIRPAGRQPANWTTVLLISVGVVVILIVAGIGGLYALGFFKPAPTQVVVIVPTAVTYPTLPPTWTASPPPSATPIPSVTPTRTPTPSATFAPPDATMAADMDKIQKQVADLRGLAIQGSVPRYLIPRDRVEDTLKGLLVDTDLVKQLENQKVVLSALGLIKPTYDLVRYALNSSSDSIGGFYLPWNKEMFVIGERFSGIERFVYSHEFDHALTDQHFHISDLGVYPTCTSNAQRCDAIRALVEGDATLLMRQWWQQYATPQDYTDIAHYNPPSQTLPDEFPPPYASEELAFPYDQGLQFVTSLYQRGNWAAVNKAYIDLPASTEQILHPDKYLAREAPITVTDASLAATLGSDWRLVDDNVLGEWTTYLLLGYGADVSAELDDATARSAARGWGGDHYQAFYQDSTGHTVLAAHWVWDTPRDATEFSAAMRKYEDLRFRGARVPRSDGDCWEANDQASCSFTKGAETLWLLAPNQTILNQVLTQFPDFP